MITVKQIYDFLKTLAPEHMAYEWDHNGLLCGRKNAEVRRILVALDPFLPLAQEAKARDCQLLLTHHPALWDLKAVNDDTATGKTLLFLCENGIAALNAHTNLDCAPGGVNDCLAAALGLQKVTVLDPAGTDAEGREYGLLRGGEVAQQSPAAFAAFVKEALHCKGLRYCAGKQPVHRVAVGGGCCPEFLNRVAELGYDTFVTADVKYNGFHDAAALGITMIDAGHLQTENPVCAYLAAKIQAAFPEIEVLQTNLDYDVIEFI